MVKYQTTLRTFDCIYYNTFDKDAHTFFTNFCLEKLEKILSLDWSP